METRKGIIVFVSAIAAFVCGAVASWTFVPALLADVNLSQAVAGVLYLRTLLLAVVITALLLIFSGRRTRYLLPVGGAFLVGLNVSPKGVYNPFR